MMIIMSILTKLRVECSLSLLNKLDISKNLKDVLKDMLKNRLNNLNFYKVNYKDKEEATLALSGGVDSVTSAIIGKQIFDIKAIFCYSKHLHSEEYLDYITNLSNNLNIDLKIIKTDLGKIYKESVLENRYHPCGRCHKLIENEVIKRAKNFVIFGDLLAFGSLSFYKINNDLYRLNLPSFFALTKDEERKILKRENIKISQRYGCLMLWEYHKKNKNYKFTIQRILREVRGRVISSEEGYNNIINILEGNK